MDQILPVRPAATVLPLRDRPHGFEVLMLRRNLRSDFVGGAYVFPGGAVDDGDADPAIAELVVGMTDADASRRLGVEHGGLAYYVAAVRELFEEAGLLLACDADGAVREWHSPVTIERMADFRRAVNNNELVFLEMIRSEGLRVDLRHVHYLAHWVTPVGPPRRFDTRFFVTRAPVDQVATHDQGETVAERWIRPADALAAQRRGEFEMILPTITNLEALAAYSSVDEVLTHAQNLTHIPRIEPRIVDVNGQPRILLPGDDGYPG